MKFVHQGLSLWYGTADALAPAEGELISPEKTLQIAASPANPCNQMTVHYRVNGGRLQTLPAVLTSTDYRTSTQYYKATFPELEPGALVEYVPTLTCSGRQTPDHSSQSSLPSSFRLPAKPDPSFSPPIPAQGEPELRISMPTTRFPFEVDYLFTVTVKLNTKLEIFGDTPEGLKVNWFVESGSFAGPTMRGWVHPHSGDWMTIRTDGIGDPGINACMETDDGALIYATETGQFELGPDGYKNFKEGKWPAEPTARMCPRYLTSHPDYLWLNRLHCLSVGAVNMEKFIITYDVYAIR